MHVTFPFKGSLRLQAIGPILVMTLSRKIRLPFARDLPLNEKCSKEASKYEPKFTITPLYDS